MHSSDEKREVDLRDPLRVLRRRAPLVVLSFLVAGGSALALSLLQTPKYTAEASLLFRDPGFDQSFFGVTVFQAQTPEREAATNLELVSLGAVADRAAKRLGVSGVSERVEVEQEGQSDVVAIAATDPDPEFATELANTFADVYVDFRRGADRQQIAAAIELIESESQDLPRQVSQLETLQALQTGNAEVVDEADVPTSPSSPKTATNTMLGGAFGLMFGIGLALLLERLDRRIRQPGELGDTFALPILGTVPNSEALLRSQNGKGSEKVVGKGSEKVVEALPFADAESFRMLRSRLRYFNVDRDVRSVVITSAAPGEGKSTVAWNLAATAAGIGSKVLSIEADLHQPSFAATRGIRPLPGLAELLTGQSSLDAVIQKVPVPERGNGEGPSRSLDVITSGAKPPNPVELLESNEMARLLDEFEERYDLVVLDTPPAGALADAIPLMKLVSGVIVVAELGKTTRDDAVHLRDQLRNLDAPVLGVVANRLRKGGRGYGYGDYYGYGSKRGEGVDLPLG